MCHQHLTQADCNGDLGNGFGCVWDFEDFECEIGIIGHVNCEYIADPTQCANEPTCFFKEDECKTMGGNNEVEGMEIPEEFEGPGLLKKTHQQESTSSNEKYYFAAAGFVLSATLSGAAFFLLRKKANPEMIQDLYRDIDLDYSARV